MAILFILVFLLLAGISLSAFNKRFHYFGSFGGFMLGVGLAVALSVAFFILLLIFANLLNMSRGGDILWFVVFFVGLSQLVYIIPVAFWLNHNKLYDMLKGVATGALLIALLNGSCFLFLLPAMRF